MGWLLDRLARSGDVGFMVVFVALLVVGALVLVVRTVVTVARGPRIGRMPRSKGYRG